jgi:diaminopimelate decarboxylase
MKRPFVTKEKIQEIIKEVPTPFHIYDEKGIRENARLVNQAFSWNEGFREYFAVKAEPNPVIMQVLKEEGCGSDCSSLTELMLAKAVGNGGEMTMFSSNETPDEEYVYASDMGAIVNLDDFTMIDAYAKAVGHFPKKMCCRFNPAEFSRFQTALWIRPANPNTA